MEGDEDFARLSVDERLSHKNWKARVSAYTELISSFKTSIAEDAPEFSPYLRDPSLLVAAIKDANAVAQETGLQCACAFVEFGGRPAAAAAKVTFTAALVEKNILGSARAGSKKAAVELCLLLVECEGNAEAVFEACIEGVKSKQPKAAAGAVLVVKEVVRQFGTKVVNVKPVLKIIAAIFAHADKGVRAEATQLVQELHRWLGAALDPSLSDLKPVQQKELAELFAGEEKACQTRFTRAQQREKALKEAEASLNANNIEPPHNDEALAEVVEADAPVDESDLSEPQEILNKMPTGFYENLASAKWKDRKELALDPLLELLKKTPRLQDGNYDELVRALAERMPDANIACVISAAGCIECLAKGLRQNFGRYKSVVMPSILERCKEKKTSVIDALAAALDNIFESVTISELTDDVTTFAKHKNPQVKEQTFRFLVRALRSTKVAPSIKTDLKPLADALLLGLEDSFGPVRDSAAEGLGTLQKVVGDRPMSVILDTLDDIKKKKVLEFAEKAEVKCQGTAAAAPPSRPSGKATVAPSTKSAFASQHGKRPHSPSESDKENNGPTPQHAQTTSTLGPKPAGVTPRKPPVLSSMKKTVQASAASGPTVKPSANVKASTVAVKPSPMEPLKYRFTQEDAEAQADTVLPASILADLKDSAWKVRLAAVESLQTWLEGEGQAAEAELVVRVLAKTPGWKESNFQIYGKMANLFASMAVASSTWSRACSALTIGPLTDKLGDIKLKKLAGDALIAYAERFSLQFVLSQGYDSMTKQKAPKNQSEALNWIEQALRDFGVTGLAARELVEFLKTALKSSNASVRTSAMKALVTLRIFVGPDIKAFVQELNPTLLSTIDAEFGKVNGEMPPTPTRSSADNAQVASAASGKGQNNQGDPLEDLFPRQDVNKLISSATVKSMSDANWKQRKEALESIQGILEANSRLKPTLGELGNALKQRLPDSNKVVQGLALDVIARLAVGMGKPFDRSARLFVGPICGILADAKPTVRAPALAALNAIEEQCGLEGMIPQVAAGLEPANPLQRSEIATWLSRKLVDAQGKGEGDLTPLVGPVITCLEDKSTEVRKAAQSLLPFIISNVGYSRLSDRAASLKPASRSVVIPMLETAKAAAAAKNENENQPSASSAGNSIQPASAASEKQVVNHLTKGSAIVAGKGLPAVTRTLKATSNTVRAHTPTSRPGSSISKNAAFTPSSGRVAQDIETSTQPSGTRHNDFRSSPESPARVPLFRTIDSSSKQSRAAREVGPLKWTIDGSARPDQVEFLQQQMMPHGSPELLKLMFSRDHNSDRDHAASLVMLTTFAQVASYDELEASTSEQQETRARLLASSDIVLKYLTIRLCDQSTNIVLCCLDLIEAVFRVMLLANYHLSDYEATSFLPSLILKLGDPKEAIRARTRAVIRSFGSIYPSSKVFAQLLEYGCRARVARTRAESIEELGFFIQRQGLAVCQPKKALPEIASLLTDKDASARSAALGALAEAYKQVGDDIFGYLGELAPKEQTMLDERLKRTHLAERLVYTGPTTTSTPTRSSSRQSLASSESRPMNTKGGATSSRLPALSSTKRRMSALPTPLDPAHRQSTRTTTGPTGHHSPEVFQTFPARQNMMMDEPMPQHSQRDRSVSLEPVDQFGAIKSSNIAESVDALKRVQKTIVDNSQALCIQATPLISAMSAQMAFAFEGLDQNTPQPMLRLCKHLMQTLSGFFDRRELSLAVSKAALATLLGELTKRLLETADSGASDAIISLSKVLNMVLIRIFHNSDNSACFGSLFLILERVTLNLRDLSGEELSSRAKYAELVMKCLWKISKSVKENLEDGSLDPKILLVDIDRFLQAIPPAEWRRRASDGIPLSDMPLRTVKTILQQVVATYGDSVYEQLALLDKAENSFVYQYLFRLLNNSRPVSESLSATTNLTAPIASPSQSTSRHRQSRTSPESEKHGDQESGNGSSAGGLASTVMSPTRSTDIEMNLALKDIFDKIGNAQASKVGIAELYQFKLQHPEAETRINTWIAATGSFFQSYLRRALSNMAAEEAERNGEQMPSASPVSSRPSSFFPSAPSSPKIGVRNAENREHASSSPVSAARDSSRVVSGSLTASDERLDSLKQMFGVSRMNVAK